MVWNINYWVEVFKRISYIFAIFVGVLLSFKLAIFYMPFLFAFIISLLMEPAIKFLMRKFNFSRRKSSIIIFILTFSVITGAFIWGILTLISESSNLLNGINYYFEIAYNQIQNIINNIKFDNIKFSNELVKIVQDSTGDYLYGISEWFTNFLSGILNIVTSLPTIGIYLVITILSLYFICTDKIYMLDTIEHHIPRKWVKKIGNHVKEISYTLGGYLKAELMLIFISFIISLIGFYILKFLGFNINYPLLIALGIAFVDALPILGSGTVMIPWGILSALNGNLKLGISIIILWIIMSIVRQFLEPKFVSNKIGIHPIFTLLSMYTGFKFIGLLGMFVGPILLIIYSNIFSTILEQGLLKIIFDKR